MIDGARNSEICHNITEISTLFDVSSYGTFVDGFPPSTSKFFIHNFHDSSASHAPAVGLKKYNFYSAFSRKLGWEFLVSKIFIDNETIVSSVFLYDFSFILYPQSLILFPASHPSASPLTPQD
jgi:hypothetical protein